jgi:hypothetical protein
MVLDSFSAFVFTPSPIAPGHSQWSLDTDMRVVRAR